MPACLSWWGTNAVAFYRLGNEGVNIEEPRLAQLNVHTAQNVNRVGYGFPVKFVVILNL